MKGKHDELFVIGLALACILVGGALGFYYATHGFGEAAGGTYLTKSMEGKTPYECWYNGPDGKNYSGTCYLDAQMVAEQMTAESGSQ
ncbi:Uncharacterised protein [Candidatus Norongarragalina meridionalis]|nr:Uncharacterised protein [Candidatus Norongarragalina meridionalis]